MWLNGPSLDELPMRPQQATQFLSELANSTAEDQVKHRVSEMQLVMRNYEHYFAIADHIDEFAPTLCDVCALVNSPDGSDAMPLCAQQQPVVLQGGFLVVRRNPGSSDLSLEPEMLEACGDRCAKSLEDLRTVFVAQWTYGDRPLVFDRPASNLGLDHHAFRCRLSVIDVASRQVVYSKTFERTAAPTSVVIDPKRMTIPLLHAVRQELVRLLTSSATPKQP
jgi:hypothetical protein